MRKEIILCDVCGKAEGHIDEYVIVKPIMYKLGSAPAKPSYEKMDMHKRCAERVAGLIEDARVLLCEIKKKENF